MLENDTKRLNSEAKDIHHLQNTEKARILENEEKIKLNKQLPYLVGNVVEILDAPQEENDASAMNIDSGQKKPKVPSSPLSLWIFFLSPSERGFFQVVVVKTSTRQTIYLPVPGLVDADALRPGDLIGVNKDSYLILDTLPPEYDARVKAMEVDEKPAEEYSDIGGLDKQILELVEAVVLPVTRKKDFEALGIKPPKGVLLYGPPGTGKSMSFALWKVWFVLMNLC